MAEIASMFISPFLQVVFERMVSHEFVDFFRGRKLNDELIMRLKMTLMSVNAVLEDAEGKQFTKPDVKEWLDELKHAVYDAEDVLDEIATKALQRKLDAEFGTFGSKVRNPISTSRFVEKIEKLLNRLEFLGKQKEALGLREGVGVNPSERLTTSLVDESSTFGRHDEKDAIVNSLLSDDASGSEIGVIAIVGMGGIGKTTLAQLAYNDNRVKKHFELKAWVCVSDDFDVLKITKSIVEKVTAKTCDTEDLDHLQNILKDKLMKNKLLLVLDDVWNKYSAKWELLSIPFKFGVQGSKVVVTTRDSEVALAMLARITHRINELPKEDCWSLFVKYAFHNGNPNACLELEALGRKIVEKCKGLPLAIKAIGALLQSKLDVDEWDKVLRSELWNLPIEETGILPALGLSYKYLSSHLKRCFAYCSIFPKDYAFEKDKLVLLWMAEGFLPQPENKTMEEVGNDYFLALVSRSLFQQSSDNKYIMHDLVSDLAKFIFKQFTLCLEDCCSCDIGSKTRHLSDFFTKFRTKKFGTSHKAKRLRTIVNLNFFGDGWLYRISGTQLLLPMVRGLRVLILSHYAKTEFPNSIGKLIHLRYLDISYSIAIKRLPDSICELCNLQALNLSYCSSLATFPRDMHKLYNLQILNLSHCWGLSAWPRDMHKLINLRHLDFYVTQIMEMPINLGRLKCLQTLTRFIVSKNNESCIRELGKLTNLRGSLPILVLQNVESPTDTKDRSLRDVKHLDELLLEWSSWTVDTNASESDIIVLDSLQPHSNLKRLTIKGYCGKSFSSWVGDASFSNISSLRLENCKFCGSLPSFEQLPSLQYLWIVGLDALVTVGRQFYGSGSSLMKPFGALKFLWFESMLKWKEWFPFEAENEGVAFPNLEELHISECPELTRGLPVYLPSLVKLFVYNCPQLVVSLPKASSLHKLALSNCNTILLRESLTGLQELNIQSCWKLELPMHLNYSSLEYLTLDGCGFLKSFPLYPKLRRLIIYCCGDLEFLLVREHEHDLLLSQIDIRECHNFANFPKGGLRAPNLKKFRIENCRSLRSLPDKMHLLLPSLDDLYIRDCPQVESFPEGGLPSNLIEIYIFNCDKLFVRRMGWGLQKLTCVRRFSIGDKSEDVDSFPDEWLLPTSLTNLHILGFPNLKYLDTKGLQHLTALKELKIWFCPKLECMPKGWLPASLSTTRIYGCPLLEKN